jgi:hypothetical protein
MLTYEQIEAIHEAMRELESRFRGVYDDDDRPRDLVWEGDVSYCLAKIRAALAGETKPIPFSADGLAALEDLKERLGDWSNADDLQEDLNESAVGADDAT